ncbi:MAG: creatininase family protein [Acetobacteraceae bacterium]
MPTRKVRLAELTQGEMQKALQHNPVVLLPMGSFEDQGPHAPMGDFLSAARIAELIAEHATDAGVETLVSPAVPFGCDDYFGASPGGISLQPATFRAVISDIFGSLVRHDLKRLIVINGHGGNVPVVHEVAAELYRRQHVLIPSLYLWKIGYGLLPGILGAERARAASGHGADPLTSVAMHLFPELMRPDLVPEPIETPMVLGLPPSGFGMVAFEDAEIHIPLEYNAFAPDAVRGGDPRLSSSATGKVLVERLTALGARFVAHYARHVG